MTHVVMDLILKNGRVLVGMSTLFFGLLAPPIPWHGRWFCDVLSRLREVWMACNWFDERVER